MAFPLLSDALLARIDQPVPRYTSYPTAPAWRSDFGPADLARALADAARDEGPLSLYVHIPFCKELCSYCGCNVVVSKDRERTERYLDALSEELALLAGQLGDRRQLARVHLGGGTPTFLDEGQLARLGKEIFRHFELLPGAEVAVEIDPVVTRPSQIELLAGMGWNRVSFGVQDFDPDVQRAVNRIQSIEATAASVDAARAAGFGSVNFDLIYGLPKQTPESWAKTMDEVVRLGPDRLAVYSFAYLPAQRPNQRRLPSAHIPSGRQKLDLLRIAHDRLLAGGYEAIGIDHFARPDDELARARRERRLWRDFQGYTVRRAGDTVGVGASAISTLEHAIAQSTRALGQHASAIREGRLATERGMWISDDDRRRRDVIIQLMCNDWVDLGADAEEVFPAELARLRELADDGLCALDGTQVSLTPLGQLLARVPASVFDAHLASADRCSKVV
jgi:oxygen-independent coproporphyrinogen-3 oxidase